MKKSCKSSGKGTLKKKKEEIKNNLEKQDYITARDLSYEFIKTYPNNIFGYVSCIESLTFNYNKFLNNDDLKEVKNVYNSALNISSKAQKEELKQKFDEYLYDIKEVENLRKIKIDITSKLFLMKLNDDTLAYINQNLNTLSLYGKTGVKIKNVYDFIRGFFFFLCMIYNLFWNNALLIITIPFGIYGIITMYSFIEMNFLKKGKYKIKRQEYEKIVEKASENALLIKQEIAKIEENVNFLYDQKASSINKLPFLFTEDIKDLTNNDEKEIADSILELFTSNELVKFNILLEEKTNLNAEDVINKINNNGEELSKYTCEKLSERKNNQSEALLMKPIKLSNIFVLIITLLISILSFGVIINNFYELNYESFLLGMITGVLSTLFYNIDTGKHLCLSDTFNDNLLSTVFNSSLVYNLIYASITNDLSLTYSFIQIPIIFILIFIGFVKLISLLKYNHLLKKLRK